MIWWQIILFVIGSIAVSALLVFIINLFDTSPTKDDRCRGGHDI